MIEMTNLMSYDADAVHLNKAHEIESLDATAIPSSLTSLVMVEDPRVGYLKRKITIHEILSAESDLISILVPNQFSEVPEKTDLIASDHLLIEDSEDTWAKKHTNISDLPLEDLTDGIIFKKYLATERSKLTGIEDLADVTDVINVTSALNLISIDELSDITSPGVDIESAVTLKHTQGTDTQLGTMSQDINMGSHRIENCLDPVDPQDVATKEYVDTSEVNHDPFAIHVNAANEINSLPPKMTAEITDSLVIENSSDSYNKNRITFNSITMDILSDGTVYKRFFEAERIKLVGIEPAADVTDEANVTTALNLISIDEMSDITSSGVDIESAVTLKHSQGTDTQLGVMTQAIDMGSYKIENCLDPVDPQDVATREWVENAGIDDPFAIHKNVANEINSLPPKMTAETTDSLVIENSSDSYNKNKITFASVTMDILTEGTSYKKFSVAEQSKLTGIEPLADVTDAANVSTALANGVASLTSSEVLQLSNINTNVISTGKWDILSEKSADFRIVYTTPGVNTYYFTFRPTITDTRTTYGLLHFLIKVHDSTNQQEELYEVSVLIPKDCFYDQTSNPPIVSIKGNFHSSSPFMVNLLTTSYDTNYNFNFYLQFASAASGVEISFYDLWDATLKMGDGTDGGGTSYPTYTINHTLNFLPNKSVSTVDRCGSVKITSNVDTSQPTLNLAIGVEQQLIYTNPLLDSQTYYPETTYIKDVTSLYDDVGAYTGIFLENPVLGQPQYWRLTLSYSAKSVNDNVGLYIKLVNPVSGFTRRLLVTLPDGETNNDFLTVDVSTYADTNSLAAPLGAGTGGYQFWIEAVSDTITVVVEDVARLNF